MPPKVDPVSGTDSDPWARTSPVHPSSGEARIRDARVVAVTGEPEAGSDRSTIGGAHTASARSATTSQRAAGTMETTYVAARNRPHWTNGLRPRVRAWVACAP